jgi:sec-independent protein translocase protein TatC
MRIVPDLTMLGFGSSFGMRLRICVWLSFFLAGPFALYQAWAFVAAGLYKHERSIVYRYLPTSLLLFVSGVAFGFFVLIPYCAYFLSLEGLGENRLMVESTQYLDFIKALSLAVGIVFQLPLVQVLLSRLGFVDPKLYGKYRGHMAIATLTIAAIITPPDMVSQLMLSIPALILYEIGAIIARVVWVPVPGALEPARAGR